MKNIYLYLVIFFSNAILAQEKISIISEVSNDTIGYYDILTLKFEVNEDYEDFIKPDFKDFKISNIRASQKVSYDEKGVKTTSKIIYYDLSPKKMGNLLIEKAVFKLKKNKFETEPINVFVKNFTEVNNPLNKSNEIFVIAEISDYHPFKHQPINVNYRVYLNEEVAPEYYDFKMESDYDNQYLLYQIPIEKYKMDTINYNNKKYISFILRKDVLAFNRLYDLYLNNRFVVSYKKILQDGHNFKIIKLEKKTLPIISERIKVKNLETDIKFPEEIVAFGNFKLDIILPNKLKIRKSEIIEIKIQLHGEGYLSKNLIPKLFIPSEFEILSDIPEMEIFFENGVLKSFGKRTYKIRTNSINKFKFYPLKFYFYNLKEDKKEALKTEAFNIIVK